MYNKAKTMDFLKAGIGSHQPIFKVGQKQGLIPIFFWDVLFRNSISSSMSMVQWHQNFSKVAVMLLIKSKYISYLLYLCLISGLLSPALTQADEINAWGGDSGSIDAGKAAEQRAAAAKRAAKKQKKAEEKKAAEPQKGTEAQKRETVTK